jgi:hypothetical protein
VSTRVDPVGAAALKSADALATGSVIELDKVAGTIGGAVGQSLAARLSAPGMPTSRPVDVWIGTDGLVQRASIDESLPVAGGTADVQGQVDISGYGTPLSVTAPPADQVFDLTGLVSNLAAGLAAAVH